jgi:hypothetical protein
MAFDPDAFLAQTAPPEQTASGFDPDAFLAATAPQESRDGTVDDRQRDDNPTPVLSPVSADTKPSQSSPSYLDVALASSPAGQMIGKIMEVKDTPLIKTRSISQIREDQQKNGVPWYEREIGADEGRDIMSAIHDVGAENVSGVSTPQNIAIIGGLGEVAALAKLPGAVGASAKAAFGAASAWFAYEGVKETPKAVQDAIKITRDPDSTAGDITKAWLRVGPPAAMLAGGIAGGLHSLKGSPKAVKATETAPATIPETVPAPSALPETTNGPSIVSKIESAQGQTGSPAAINAAVNEAIIKPVETPAPPAPPAPAAEASHVPDFDPGNIGARERIAKRAKENGGDRDQAVAEDSAAVQAYRDWLKANIKRNDVIVTKDGVRLRFDGDDFRIIDRETGGDGAIYGSNVNGAKLVGHMADSAPPAPAPRAAGDSAPAGVDYAAEQNRTPSTTPSYAVQEQGTSPLAESPQTRAGEGVRPSPEVAQEPAGARTQEAPVGYSSLNPESVTKMAPGEFLQAVKEAQTQSDAAGNSVNVLTDSAGKAGEAIRGDKQAISEVEAKYEASKKVVEDLTVKAKAAKGTPAALDALNEQSDAAYKSQFLGEVIAAAKNEGSYATKVGSELLNPKSNEVAPSAEGPDSVKYTLVGTSKASKPGVKVEYIATKNPSVGGVHPESGEPELAYRVTAVAGGDPISHTTFNTFAEAKADALERAQGKNDGVYFKSTGPSKSNELPLQPVLETPRLPQAGAEGQPRPAGAPAEQGLSAIEPAPVSGPEVAGGVRAEGASSPGNAEVGSPAAPGDSAIGRGQAAASRAAASPTSVERLEPVSASSLPDVPVQPSAELPVVSDGNQAGGRAAAVRSGRDGVPAGVPEPTELSVNRSLKQNELALKAQDPETYNYLQEQLEMGKNRPSDATGESVQQGMTQAEYDAAVSKASSSLAAKPGPDAISTKRAFEPERPAPADGGAEPPLPPAKVVSGFYDEPVGPRNDTPEGLGLPSDRYRQGLTALPVLGDYVFAPIKRALGTIRQNVSAVNKRLGGVITSSEFERTTGQHEFHNMIQPLSDLARQNLTRHGVDLFGRLLMNRDIPGAKAFAEKYTSKGKEFSAAIDQARVALDKSHEMQQAARGEDIGHLPDYFPRKVKDLKGLKKFFNQNEKGLAEAAIEKEAKRKNRKLTREEEAVVLDNLIRDSATRKGTPGYLKERTLQELDANTSKFYEPFDVAMDNHFLRVVDDYVDHRYFGKEQGSYARGEGIFGEVFADELAKGNLEMKGNADPQKIIADNLRDRFALHQASSEAAYKTAEAMRTGTAAAYLGQISVAINQFGDAINTAFHTNPLRAAKGYTRAVADALKGKSRLDDINVHQGNPDIAQHSSSSNWASRGTKYITHIGVGISDAFNKNGALHAFGDHFASIIEAQRKAEAQNPKAITKAYDRLREKYAYKFPERWKKMFEDVGNRDFEKGNKMSNDAKLMLYNELSDFQPLNKSEMAQGYNAAGPLGKTAYNLKSFWIKQLGAMRERGYERIKDPRTRLDGIAYLASYTAVVSIGGNVLFQYLRDQLAGRPTELGNAVVDGMLQAGGLNRYVISQASGGHTGDALISLLSPTAGLINEAGHDLGLARDMVNRRGYSDGRPVVEDVNDLVKQSKLVRHFPILGSIYYNRAGGGKALEDKKRQDADNGKYPKTTLQSIEEFFKPPDKTTEKQ